MVLKQTAIALDCFDRENGMVIRECREKECNWLAVLFTSSDEYCKGIDVFGSKRQQSYKRTQSYAG